MKLFAAYRAAALHRLMRAEAQMMVEHSQAPAPCDPFPCQQVRATAWQCVIALVIAIASSIILVG